STTFVISYAANGGKDVTLTAQSQASNPPEEVFVLGLDNQVYAQKIGPTGSSASGYIPMANGQVAGLVVGHDGNNLTELFVLGLDSQVYALHVNAGGTATGGYFLAAMGKVQSFAVGYDASNHPELFAI